MLTYVKLNFSNYTYMYNIYLNPQSRIYVLCNVSYTMFYCWLLQNIKFINIFKIYNLFLIFYKNNIYRYMKLLKKISKRYTYNNIIVNYKYTSIYNLKINLNNYLTDKKTVLNFTYSKYYNLKKKEYFIFYKYIYFNVSKFKDSFILLLILAPYYIINLNESFSLFLNYKLHITHHLFLLTPFLKKQYFYFQHYL